jgi:hypothetical protein
LRSVATCSKFATDVARPTPSKPRK